jgi:succinate dehydrogenase/fumarate reductase flavoprotein subunit
MGGWRSVPRWRVADSSWNKAVFESDSMRDDVYDVAVIGGGAAGLLAATHAAERGRRTLLLEKNRKLGVKILISGGTRCNLTHQLDVDAMVRAFGRTGKFLRTAIEGLTPEEVIQYVESEGVPTKVIVRSTCNRRSFAGWTGVRVARNSGALSLRFDKVTEASKSTRCAIRSRRR